MQRNYNTIVVARDFRSDINLNNHKKIKIEILFCIKFMFRKKQH